MCPDGLPTTVIRPASTYGPRGSAWSIGPVEQIKAGRLVLLFDEQIKTDLQVQAVFPRTARMPAKTRLRGIAA